MFSLSSESLDNVFIYTIKCCFVIGNDFRQNFVVIVYARFSDMEFIPFVVEPLVVLVQDSLKEFPDGYSFLMLIVKVFVLWLDSVIQICKLALAGQDAVFPEVQLLGYNTSRPYLDIIAVHHYFRGAPLQYVISGIS